MISRLSSVASLFAAAQLPPAAGDPSTFCAAVDGMITIDRAQAALAVDRETAIRVLVALRTFVHNQFIVPQLTSGLRGDPSLFASEAALSAEAAALLAGQLDEIDEVFVRLDSRVAEAQAVQAWAEPLERRDQVLEQLAHTLTEHEAAWLALRPYALEAPVSANALYEPSATQLSLPLDAGLKGVDEDVAFDNLASVGQRTGSSCATPSGRQFRDQHRHRLERSAVRARGGDRPSAAAVEVGSPDCAEVKTSRPPRQVRLGRSHAERQ